MTEEFKYRYRCLICGKVFKSEHAYDKVQYRGFQRRKPKTDNRYGHLLNCPQCLSMYYLPEHIDENINDTYALYKFLFKQLHMVEKDIPRYKDIAYACAGVKFCKYCRKYVNKTNFYANYAMPDGLQPMCKDCERRIRNKGEHKEIHERMDKILEEYVEE